MSHKGSCHCGRIRFEVEGEPDSGLACNCSMCQRRGSLLWFVGRDQLKLLTPGKDMATYTFNQHVIRHHFCANCGIHVFGEGVAPDGKEIRAVNLRALEDVDLDAVPVHRFDGRSK
jgi:hypothetical protein